jgi:tetratricopeptide (TPR) repeat protein/CHAT domain-containing protein
MRAFSVSLILLILSYANTVYSQEDGASINAKMMIIIGREFLNQGKYLEAIQAFEEALKIGEKEDNREIKFYSLVGIGRVYNDTGKFDEAIVYYEKAIKYVGSDEEKALIYNNLGGAYDNKGDYDKAIEYYKKALDIDLKVYESINGIHPSVATDYNNLGLAYHHKGDFDKAIEYYKKAMDIDLKVYESINGIHPYVARDYNNLGEAYRNKGDFDKAIEYLKKALDIVLKVYESINGIHPYVATTYNNLGGAYYDKSDYDKAIEYLKKALDIVLKVYESINGIHPYVATTYNNLGGAYHHKGDYDKAIEYYKKALDIDLKVYESINGIHPSVATDYNNLGLAYDHKGDYDKAIEYYKKALDIDLKVYESQNGIHPSVANTYNNLGGAYHHKGDFDKAIEYYKKALDIDLKVYESQNGIHPSVANTYNNLGLAYDHKGDYDKAIEYYKKALDIDLKVYESQNGIHPSVARDYNNLGAAYLNKGDYDRAIEYYKKALDIVLKVYESINGIHPDVATTYNNLGMAYKDKGDYENALKYLKKGVEIIEEIRKNIFKTSTEREQILFMEKYGIFYENYIKLLIELFIRDKKSGYLKDAFEVYERGVRAVSFEDMLSGRKAVLFGGDEELRKIYDQLQKLREEYSSKNKALDKAKGDAKENLQKELKELEGEIDKLGRLLQESSIKYREMESEKFSKVSTEDICKGMPPKSALYEMASIGNKYYLFLLKKDGCKITAYEIEKDKRFYDELIKKTRCVDIYSLIVKNEYEAKGIGCKDYYKEMSKEKVSPSFSYLKELYNHTIQPIESELKDVESIFIIPDGMFNIIPFEAFKDKDEHYLVERFNITYLTTARDLIRDRGKITSQKVLTAGLNNYSYGISDLKKDKDMVVAQRGGISEIKGLRTCSTTEKNIRWPDLNYSEDEVKESHKILTGKIEGKDTLFIGKETTERNIKKNIKGRRIIHLSVHGYYGEGKCEETGSVNMDKRGLNIKVKGEVEEKKVHTDPLANSALVFAGAGRGGDGEEDGYLTALEVLGLDLSETELTILSACETALGETITGEGVFGLRRAFHIAGARSLLASLWSVSDVASKKFFVGDKEKGMKGYLEYIKEGKKSKAEALREVKKEFISRKDSTKDSIYSHPFVWAPFILSGDWR